MTTRQVRHRVLCGKNDAPDYDPTSNTAVNHTALRVSERIFKSPDFQYLPDNPHYGSVVDARLRPSDCRLVPCDIFPNAYTLINAPDVYILSNLFDQTQQKLWITRALRDYFCYPHITNLDAHYIFPKNTSLFQLIDQKKGVTLTRIDRPEDSDATRNSPRDLDLQSDQILSLMRRIRWATIGYAYDWTTKEYPPNTSDATFPLELKLMCEALLRSHWPEWTAQAGIVNMYQKKDTLTCHIDRSEEHSTAPLISFSFGSDCIFLMGGRDRNDPVTPIILRSGDAIIMSGSSRHYFHGVPRILLGTDLLKYDPSTDDPDTLLALEILGSARININVRQVKL